MKLSTLAAVLADPRKVDKLKAELASHMQEYESLQKVGGTSIPIRVEQDVEMQLKLKDVGTLCTLFITEQLGRSELAYVADAIDLTLLVDCDDDRIVSLLSEMTDPEINGVFTIERAEEIRREIDT